MSAQPAQRSPGGCSSRCGRRLPRERADRVARNRGADRFSAPCRPACRSRCPGAAGAEVPIVSVEVALAAIFLLHADRSPRCPWCVLVIAVAITAAAVIGLRRISERRRLGLWAGFAMCSGRGRMIALVRSALRSPQLARAAWDRGDRVGSRRDRPADRNVHARPAPDQTQPRRRRGGADPRGLRRSPVGLQACRQSRGRRCPDPRVSGVHE